jgi:Ni/Co efflux regulator RcnB
MRSFVIAGLMAATAMPAVAYADPPSRAELRHDRREIREGQREVRRDVRRGDWQEAREDRREVREDRREYREDKRDAWRDYRARNRAVFHQPRYVGPAGYRYRSWRPGVRIPAAYYGPRYVIADPWHYRLHRPAAGYQRWVRYGDDVLLVDIRNGIVREVIRDFFW